MTPPRLAIRGLVKTFGRTAALRGVSFDVIPGEIHVLAGENGAGKSTLIKILSGVHADYAGEIRLDGTPLRFRSPAEAARAGIATIHQELSLVGSLSVADNLLLFKPGHAHEIVDRRAMREAAEQALREVGLRIDAERRVETLPLADRQLVEIARALTRKARVLILDEPTSALSAADAERLFERVVAIKQTGTSILYISHRMDEIYRLADRITVLRDGQRVFDRPLSDSSADEIVFALLGRSPESAPSSGRPSRREPLLRVRELSVRGVLEGVAFEVHPGEIVGLAGLGGSGVKAIVHGLYGALAGARLDVTLGGSAFAPASPKAALGAGAALVPGDRALGVFPELSLAHNASLSSLGRYARFGWVDRNRERADVDLERRRFSLQKSPLEAPAASLSGGNQQKLALIRCLLTRPRLLLLDDPTRGVDIGAKLDVHRALRKLADEGVAVLFHSTELDELGSVCDRVLGIARGRIALEMSGAAFDRTRMLAALMSGAAA
jgi:ABC-type sugar transport system ATPase subunit